MSVSPFDGWDPLPSTKLFAYPPAVYTPNILQIDVFAVDTDGQLRHSSTADSFHLHWVDWDVLCGGAVGTPAVVTSAKPFDRTFTQDVFVVGTDSALWHVSGTNSDSLSPRWGEPTSLGGVLRPDVAAVRTGTGQFDVFGWGLDGHLWHLSGDGTTWNGWEQRDGFILSAPSVVAWTETELQMVALGPASDLLHQWFLKDKRSWSGWESLGGQLSSPPVIVAPGPHRLDVFARGVDTSLQHRYWDGTSWGTRFASLGGRLSSGPHALAQLDPAYIEEPLYLEVVATQLDHTAARIYWDGTSWGSLTSFGGLWASSPQVFISFAMRRTFALAFGIDGKLYYKELGKR
jgi:hypothetical protein